VQSKADLPILDVAYRSRQLAFRRKQIAQWIENEHDLLKHELALQPVRSEEFLRERVAMIESEAVRQEKDALATFGMLEGQDPRVAPVRRALAVWGLTADDIGVVSIHGTSTQANVSFEPSCQKRRTFLTTLPNRRRTKLRYIMMCSLPSKGLRAMQFLSWRRRVSQVECVHSFRWTWCANTGVI
jgi:hypothetical protein